MAILKFDEPDLVRSLECLPVWQRVAFAAACAERLRPAYLSFSQRTGRGDGVAFQNILDRLWLDLGGSCMADDEIEMSIEKCMEFTPHEDDEPWDDSQVYAEDAGIALVYALRCRQNSESQEAAWAARHVYEALDHYVIAREDVDLSTPGAEARVLSHPLIQAELMRQYRDLAVLRDTQVESTAFRRRASKDAEHLFVEPS